MNDAPPSANSAGPSELLQQPGWRRHFTRQRLRAFIILSVAAHVILGMSWGVPAYVKQKRMEAEARRLEELRQEQGKAAQAALARAKAKDFAETVQDIQDQTHKAFDTIAGDLNQADKEKTWEAVQPKVQPAEQQLATALGDRSMTEQDLRNLQAGLDRQLVESINDTLGVDIGREEIEAFVAGVESRVIPALIAHYKSELVPKVAQPVRAAADGFVRTTRDKSATAIGAAAADQHIVADALKELSNELDAAGSELDQGHLGGIQKSPAADDDVTRHATAATAHLTTAAAAGDKAAASLAKLIDQSKPADGGSGLAERLAAVNDSLGRARDGIKTVSTGIGQGKLADAARQLTALVLAQRKLATQWTSVSDAADRAVASAEQSARGALGIVKDRAIPQQIDQRLPEAFKETASPRLTTALTEALRKRLAAAGIKSDEALIAPAVTRVKTLLETRIAIAGYGLSTSQALRDAAGSLRHGLDPEVEHLAAKFAETAKPIINVGVNDVVADATIDSRLAELVAKPEKDTGRDDVRDRVAMLAANASDGRATALDSTSFTDLRASAMARTASHDSSPGSTDVPTTGPAEMSAPPVIADIKEEILASLKAELQKVLEGKLAEGNAAKVWDHVARATDLDVSHLAQDLINPRVSDSDLEGRRLAFSGKFLDSVRGGLDKTASDDVARQLLEQLDGKAGDAVAGAYKNAVKENVGNALSREWHAAADADRSAVSQQVRDIRGALDSAKSIADKSAQILDQVKEQTSSAAQNGKDNPQAVKQAIDSARGKLQEINTALAGAQKDVESAQMDVPAEAAELKARLGEIGKAFDNLTTSVKDADKTGESGQAKPFTRAVAQARKQVEQFRSNLTAGANGLDREVTQAEGQFIKAADQAKEDSADGKAGVKSRIDGKFAGEFRKETLPRLTDQIVKGFEQKLDQAGVSATLDDTAALEKAIAAALDKKVTGDAHVGDAALADLEHHRFFDSAKNAKGDPTKEEVDRANSIADKVTDAGVAAALQGDSAGASARNAVSKTAGPDKAVGELKDKVARMQGQLRGGRGGVLADAADGADAKDAPAGVGSLRRKWQGLLAGLNGAPDAAGGDQTGSAQASANATGPGKGTGSDSGTAAGNAAGLGAGSGNGSGLGAGGNDGIRFGPGYRRYPIDEAKRKELVAAIQDRATQQGDAWTRTGADGVAGGGGREEMHPATLIAPATQPVAVTRNDQPYTPTFKSLQFAVVPYLNKPIPIDDNFDAWKDIPAIHLKPERQWLKDTAGLQIVDDLPVKIAWDNNGLYLMVDMIDPDKKIEKAHVANFWECDCPEIFLDTMNTKELRRGNGAGQQFWVWPFGSIEDENAPGGESFYDRHSGFHFVGLKPTELQRFARTTPAGYTVQCRIPIERVRDADLAPGKILGFNITIETGIRLHYYWSASKLVDTSVHPDTWGDILLGGSDAVVEFPARLTAEVGPAAAKKTVNAFPVGEPLRIRVTDRDMNLNDKVKDKVSVTVRNARREQEVAILEETGPATGVFEGSVRTSLALGERVPGILSVYEGESVSVTYIDQARANGARNTEIVTRITAGLSVMAGK